MSSKKSGIFKILNSNCYCFSFFLFNNVVFPWCSCSRKYKQIKSRSKTSNRKKSENDVMSSNFTEEDLDKLSKIRIKAQQFKDINSTYISIEDAPIDAETKKILYERALNLSQFGSFSKGKQTHEFENQAYYIDRLKELGGEKNY